MKKVSTKISNVINILALIGLSISYLSPYINPNDFWIISFFGLTFTFWLVLNFALLLLWIVAFKKRGILNAFLLLIGFQFIARNIQINSNKSETSDINVCSFNTFVQQIYNGDNTSDVINQYISDKKYDVVLLVEWINHKGSIDFSTYPHQQFVAVNPKETGKGFGLKLVSKHRIIHWERIEYDHTTGNLSALFDIEINSEIIRFVGVHLQSNKVSPKDYSTLINAPINKEYKNYAFNFVNRLKNLSQLRAKQTHTILETIKNSPYPVIILGDFNDTPQSYIYQCFAEGHKDAFMEQGSGWGATYLKPLPFLRIDYIFYDDELTCTGYQTNTNIQSDHKMIEASFKLSKP